jgi:hypothetical protein
MISFRVGFTATSIIGMAICVGTLAPSLAMMSPPGGDKLQHLVAFSAFALPMVLVERQYWRLMLTLTLLLGTAIELIQPHINHSGDPMDLLANAAGGIIGVLIGITISRLHHKMHPRPIPLYGHSFDRGSATIFRRRRRRRL